MRILVFVAVVAPACTTMSQAHAKRTASFPSTWDELAVQSTRPAPAPVAVPVVAQEAAPAPAVVAANGLLAVLDFRNKLRGADKDAVDSVYFADAVRTAVKRRAPGLKVMTRENVLVLLESSGKKLEDCEGECEVDTGRRLGADLVVSGDLVKIGSSYKLNLRLHSTHDGQLVNGAAASGHTVDELDANTVPAVYELLGSLR